MTITEIEIHDNKGATFFCTMTAILDLGSEPGLATRNTVTIKARAWGQTMDQSINDAEALLSKITERYFREPSDPEFADLESALPFGKS